MGLVERAQRGQQVVPPRGRDVDDARVEDEQGEHGVTGRGCLAQGGLVTHEDPVSPTPR